jgi:Cys-rich four helix bundle protein (predicted Tat secretion target)
MTDTHRRALVAGLAATAALLAADPAAAQKRGRKPGRSKQHGKGHDAPPAKPLTAAEKEIQASLVECVAAGRVCLSRCTDHLAAGMKNMQDCQKAVMNMLAVSQAMADVAAYRTAEKAERQALATACASFCEACEKACEPHAAHYEECNACMKACARCTRACRAYAKA